ncbi:PQQ-dependent sugar dehydrogenase [Rhodoferax sp.]|uniref:PQQ-dependent sugar dehydrogenase n=1 Tax=Rhodoferax sp. TaxID=50421 RepID=UPI0025D0C4AE|nr:PQQ-dependent sugar dehydrogenase [Rhodoferax sp.]
MTRWIKNLWLASLASLSFTVPAQALRSEVVATGLEHPWALAFLPEGRFLVTERPGSLRVIEADGRLNKAVVGLPEVAARGQGGLLDVLLDANFASNRTLFFCFSEPGATGNSTALARARLSDDRTRLEALQVIFSARPKVASSAHFGCRIAESLVNGKPDGLLFMTLGERFTRKDDAQKLDNHHGKIIRIAKDGRVPADNPFVKTAGALPEIWSYGHRNPQGLALSPKGALWAHEHGPQGGDEINVIEPGRNYGWPVITYGENYGGGQIGAGISSKDGMAQPLHYWVPSIAPSGMVFLTSTRYGADWVGNLWVGSLKFGYLNRIELAAPFQGKVVREHKLLTEAGERIRDVRQGPDGLIYVLTDSARGHLIRLQPK